MSQPSVGDKPSSYSREEQMLQVIENIRSQALKIAVISNVTDQPLATDVATELETNLSGSKAVAYEYIIKDKKKWFDDLQRANVTHYIFISLPPHREQAPESEFFNPCSQRITEVVVVNKNLRSVGHYLEYFQHVEGHEKDVVAMTLCHFAG